MRVTNPDPNSLSCEGGIDFYQNRLSDLQCTNSFVNEPRVMDVNDNLINLGAVEED